MLFCIAEHIIEVKSADYDVDIISIVPSLTPFIIKEANGTPVLSVTLTKNLREDISFREIGDFDTGNGHTKVEKNDDTGEYQFTIRNIDEQTVCLLQTNSDYSVCHCKIVGTASFMSYGLNSVLMLTYAFATARYQTLLIHASCVKKEEYAYCFIAKSGTGKSTQVSNWLKHISGCELLNDDNPIVRIIDNKAYVFGSPWSGKTPCYRNRKAYLGAITRIERAEENRVERLSPIEAFTSFLPSCSTMKWESKLYNDVMDTISKVVETTGLYTLYCLPNKESAEVCNAVIALK
ncbi:MAG: hypothetical protein HUK07_05980 [Bacteroidaceae bacterium]|nr:hypothetical protein [Bacteroidaceae bacterium]